MHSAAKLINCTYNQFCSAFVIPIQIMPSTPALANPWYYLENFEFVLRWIDKRYSDLLLPAEQNLISRYLALPRNARGLLARMVMRKGDLFRASRLNYAEIGDTRFAAQALVDEGWINQDPPLALEELFGLLSKAEITMIFRPWLLAGKATTAIKAAQLECLRTNFPDTLRFSQWLRLDQHTACLNEDMLRDVVYRENINTLTDRFRLMFFGNMRQDWSEFVLSDLGRYVYEKVDFAKTSRAFQSREDVDAYLHLHRSKERLADGIAAGNATTVADVQESIPPRHDNDWIEARRGKLLFQIGRYHERLGNWEDALSSYASCSYPQARARRIRVLERAERYDEALEIGISAIRAPESEAEQQLLARMMPRLLRRTGKPVPFRKRAIPLHQTSLLLPGTFPAMRVEQQVRDYLQAQTPGAPVFYVENALINSLFGLLCWDAVFAAIPGAFFHPFQAAPSDLLRADFHSRRQPQFASSLTQLESGQYRDTIWRNYVRKAGIQSPFVAWDFITHDVLEQALACMPARHLQLAFKRLMHDIRSNRSGLPDLIQFWPAEQRYQMIEVKGPGDRLQDNQVRWLSYFHEHGLPVSVCYVQHEASAA